MSKNLDTDDIEIVDCNWCATPQKSMAKGSSFLSPSIVPLPPKLPHPRVKQRLEKNSYPTRLQMPQLSANSTPIKHVNRKDITRTTENGRCEFLTKPTVLFSRSPSPPPLLASLSSSSSSMPKLSASAIFCANTRRRTDEIMHIDFSNGSSVPDQRLFIPTFDQMDYDKPHHLENWHLQRRSFSI